MSNLATRLVQRLANAVLTTRAGRLGDDEKRAVLALMNAVVLSDGVLSPEETSAMSAAAQKLGVAQVKELALPDAIATLVKRPAALKLACLLVADAFFVDGDYDASEKAFVASFSKQFNLAENPLKTAVENLRRQTLEAALATWNAELEQD